MLYAALVIALAQTSGQASVEAVRPSAQELLDAKLASKFLTLAPWELDFAAARADAAAHERLILGYFTTTGP